MKNIGMLLTVASMAIGAWPAELFAQSSGRPERAVVVADMRGLGPVRAWWANLYNASPFWSAIATVLIVVVLGLSLSALADVLFNRLDMDLKPKPR